MTGQLLEKAHILYQQKRYPEAEKIFAELISLDPTNAQLLGMYGDVLRELDKTDLAEKMINNAIGLAPQMDVLHYKKALVLISKEKYDAAEDSLERAININPEESGYFSAWALIKLERKQFKKALELANQALELDPEDILALNSRSSAQLKLNKKDESARTIEGALREDPNNAFTHANYGWNLLEKGDHKKALTHFSESLKLDPNFTLAQAGMMQALKARYVFYRLFLKYVFWMGKLTAKYQWMVIIGFYLLFRFLRGVADANEALQPFITPILIIMGLMAFSTWIMAPVSNLFLRLNKYGQHLLDKHEKMSSNFVGISGLVFAIGIILFFTTGDMRWMPVAVFGLAMMIPLSQIFSRVKSKALLWTYSGLLLLFGLLAIFRTFEKDMIVNFYSTIFLFGIFGFQILTNYILIKADNK
jgi:tetratricopeptide (TPR) repeat protein